jgi:hypothetical protein
MINWIWFGTKTHLRFYLFLPEILRVLKGEKLGLEINQRFYRIKKNPSIGTDGSFKKVFKKLYRSSKGFEGIGM